MAHSTNCGSAGGGNFQSAIALNAQPGNIINTPSAADGDILVFVEDADHTDCNGRGAYLNFKPLVFDLRSNTGNKYIDMGVSHTGGDTPVILWLHKISSSELSYFSPSQHGTNYMGESTHTEGFLGINTHANTQDQNPYAHLHIYSKLGPSLFMESAAAVGPAEHKDPSFWMRNPENESSTAIAGFSVYTQRPNLIHSFEQAHGGDINFRPDLDTTSIFQMWKRDMIDTGANKDPAISIGKLSSGQNATINDIGTYMITTPGSFNILTQRPSLLMRSSRTDGSMTWGDGGTTISDAPHIRMMSRRYNYIHMSGQALEPGSSTTPGSTVLLSDGTNKTLHIYINDSTTFTSNEMMRFDAKETGDRPDSVTIYPKLHVEDLSYFKKTADFDGDAEINTLSNINLNHQTSKLTIKPGSVSSARVEFGTASDRIPLYLQGDDGEDGEVIVNVGGQPEWQQFSSGMKTTVLEYGNWSTGTFYTNNRWDTKNCDINQTYKNTDWYNKYGDWQCRGTADHTGQPDDGNPKNYLSHMGVWQGCGCSDTDCDLDNTNGASPGGTDPWPPGYIRAVMTDYFYGAGYCGGDKWARNFIDPIALYPAGHHHGTTGYDEGRLTFRAKAYGDPGCLAGMWGQYTLFFIQDDPEG